MERKWQTENCLEVTILGYDDWLLWMRICRNSGNYVSTMVYSRIPQRAFSKWSFQGPTPTLVNQKLCDCAQGCWHMGTCGKRWDTEYEVWNGTSICSEKEHFSHRLIGYSDLFISLIVFLKSIVAFFKGFFIYSDNNPLSAICMADNVLRL